MGDLKRHMMKPHYGKLPSRRPLWPRGSVGYECNWCNTVCSNPNDLADHQLKKLCGKIIQASKGTFWVQCSECGVMCVGQRELENHQNRGHTRKVPCGVCGKLFPHKD